jgi:hypothetical protein
MALWPTQPPIQWLPGALSLGVSGRGVKLTTHLHLAPSSGMRGAIPPLPQYVFMAWYLVKHRDNFTFTCTSTIPTATVNVEIFCPSPSRHKRVVALCRRITVVSDYTVTASLTELCFVLLCPVSKRFFAH